MKKVLVWLIILVLSLIPFLFDIMNNPHVETARCPLEFKDSSWINDCVVDENKILGDSYDLQEELYEVFKATGVQPIVYVSADLSYEEMQEIYDFTYVDCVVLFIGSSQQYLWTNDSAKLIWDDEATSDVFWTYFNKYYKGTADSLVKVWQKSVTGVLRARNTESILWAAMIRLVVISVIYWIVILVFNFGSSNTKKNKKTKKVSDEKEADDNLEEIDDVYANIEIDDE